MRYLPVTVFTVLTGSLLYALIFGPVLGSLFGKAGSRDEASMNTLKRSFSKGDPRTLKSITGVYARLLALATRYAIVTMMVTVTILISAFWAYGQYGGGMIFFSDAEPKFANVSVRARGNLSVDEINELVHEVENEVLEVNGIASITSVTLAARPPQPARRYGSVK